MAVGWNMEMAPKSNTVENIIRGHGFVNRNTVCFVNSTVQALFHCPMFLAEMESIWENHTPGRRHTLCITCSLRDAFNIFLNGPTGRQGHTRIARNSTRLGFTENEHHDAGDFFNQMINAIKQEMTDGCGVELTSLPNLASNRLDNLFKMSTHTRRECTVCHTILHTTETEGSPLSIFQQESLEGSLLTHLDGNGTIEVLCDTCGGNTNSISTQRILKAPNMFIFQFKKDQITEFNAPFPHILELGNPYLAGTVDNPFRYELRAVQYRLGASRESGHFKSAVKRGNQWWLMNDTRVTKLTNRISQKKVFYLYYERMDDEGMNAAQLSESENEGIRDVQDEVQATSPLLRRSRRNRVTRANAEAAPSNRSIASRPPAPLRRSRRNMLTRADAEAAPSNRSTANPPPQNEQSTDVQDEVMATPAPTPRSTANPPPAPLRRSKRNRVTRANSEAAPSNENEDDEMDTLPPRVSRIKKRRVPVRPRPPPTSPTPPSSPSSSSSESAMEDLLPTFHRPIMSSRYSPTAREHEPWLRILSPRVRRPNISQEAHLLPAIGDDEAEGDAPFPDPMMEQTYQTMRQNWHERRRRGALDGQQHTTEE